MAEHINAQFGDSIKQQLSGIVEDAHQLGSLQLALLRLEVEARLHSAKGAMVLAACGGALVVPGLMLLCFMTAHAIAASYPMLSLWVCFGVVGAPVFLIGGLCLWIGSRRIGNALTHFDGYVQPARKDLP